MHHPAAGTVAPGPEKTGESAHTRLADNALLMLQRHRYSHARDPRWIKYGCCLNSIIIGHKKRFLAVQQHSVRIETAPWASRWAAVIKAALTGFSGMLFVYSLLSVPWRSRRLRGVRSCGCRHGLASRVFSSFQCFLLLGFD